MSLVARRTLDRIHLLDGRCFECLRVHRVARVNHLPGIRAFDQNAVHNLLARTLREERHAIKIPPFSSERLCWRDARRIGTAPSIPEVAPERSNVVGRAEPEGT